MKYMSPRELLWALAHVPQFMGMVRGQKEVTPPPPMSRKDKEKRKRRNKMAHQSRRENRGR